MSAPVGDRQPSPLGWRFRPTHWAELAVGGVHLAGALYLQIGIDEPGSRWRGPILFDQPLRDLLEAGGRTGRDRAATISDALYYGLLVLPVVDPTVAWLAHDAPDTAWHLFVINFQSMALAAVVGTAFSVATARERPHVEPCRADPDFHFACDDRGTVSHPSGHTVTASASAALTCVNHEHLALFGGGAPDVMACVGAVGVAIGLGALRVVSASHYASDVVGAWLIGFLAGYLVPEWAHYDAPLSGVLLPRATTHSLEIGWLGWY